MAKSGSDHYFEHCRNVISLCKLMSQKLNKLLRRKEKKKKKKKKKKREKKRREKIIIIKNALYFN